MPADPMHTHRSPLEHVLELTPALSPAGTFLTGEDRLRVTSFNSLAGVELAVEGRLYVPGAGLVPFAQRHVPNTDRTSASTLIHLAEGWLIDVHVRASSAAPRRGQCFIVLELVRGSSENGAAPLAVLAQGYVTDTSRLGYPGSAIRSSIEGPGVVRSITGTDPAAGAEISETVPTNARWRFVSGVFTLVNDATVANRQVTLLVDDGANTFYRVLASGTQAANLTRNYVAYAAGIAAATASPDFYMPLPPDLILPAGARIRTSTSSLQAGDNFSAMQFLVEEWIEV